MQVSTTHPLTQETPNRKQRIKSVLEFWEDKKAEQLHFKFANTNIPAEPKCAQKRAIKNGKTKDYILFALHSHSLCRFFSSCVVPWQK